MFRKILVRPLYLWSGIAVLIVIAGGWWYFGRSDKPSYELFAVSRGDIVQEVSVTGRVKPARSVELSFDKTGRVVWVGAEVGAEVSGGQALAQLYNADLKAQLAEAEANLKAKEAKLAELRRGTRLEDVQIQEAKVDRAAEEAADKIRDAYTKTDDAVRNKVDQFFSNPRSDSPQLNFAADSQLEGEIESGRLLAEKTLNSWSLTLVGLSADSNITLYAADAKENLEKVQKFLDKVALAVNALKSSASLTQTTVDSWRADVWTARTNVNTALNNLSASETNWVLSLRELNLKKAGSSAEEILAQESEVQKAAAGAENIRAQIAKTFILAPFGGVVTRQEAKVGEIVSVGVTVAAVISEAEFEIEANLPEADIAKIKVGNAARITLDAYGDEVVFNAALAKIDPAETVVEGVATYKITIAFASKDERIKSGLTANVDIIGERREGAIIVPQRAVISRNGGKFVRVLKNGDPEEQEVNTGLKGSDGNIEIVSGLSQGEEVIVFEE